MNRYKNDFSRDGLNLFEKFGITLFVLGYPFLVSIYSLVPPLIGLVGYLIIHNVDRNKVYVFSGIVYLLNLELNLTLPILLSLFVVVMVRVFIYSKLKLLIHCKVCLLFIMIVLMDFFYYMTIFLYDAMFDTTTVVANAMLIYYIIIDVLIGVFI